MKNLILIITMFFGFFTLNPMTAQNTKVTKNSNTKQEVDKMATPARGDVIYQTELKNTTEAKTKRLEESLAKRKENSNNSLLVRSNQDVKVKEFGKSKGECYKNTANVNKTGEVKQNNSSSEVNKKGEMKPNVPATDNKVKLEAPKTQEKTK